MAANLKPEKRLFGHFIGPLAPFFPQLFSETGNVYRRRFLISILLCVLFMSTGLLFTSLANPNEKPAEHSYKCQLHTAVDVPSHPPTLTPLRCERKMQGAGRADAPNRG
jgi:hypothetical protein